MEKEISMSSTPYVVGFDLGHGETALTRLRSGTMRENIEPEVIEIDKQKVLTTVVGIDGNGAVYIGYQVQKVASSLIQCETRFKHPALDNHPKAGRFMRLFVREIANKLAGSLYSVDPAEAIFFVGCPSGWSLEVQRAYLKLLRESGLQNVHVVPESRAALIWARQTRAIDSEKMGSRILVIDIGSSTTDITYSVNLNAHKVDFGANEIGAGILDQLIYDYILENLEDDHAADQAALIRRKLETYPGRRVMADLKVRAAKHAYFSIGEAEDYVAIDKGILLPIKLNHEFMSRIIDNPSPLTGNVSWRRAFENYLHDTKAKIGEDPQIIVVTGGAARMDFAVKIIADVFKSSSVLHGTEPEFAIARGLAWFGCSYLRTMNFIEDVDRLIDSKKIETLVKEKAPKLYGMLAQDLAKGLTDNIMLPEMLRWKSGKTRTLAEVERRCESLCQEWFRKKSTMEMIKKTVAAWFEDLRPALHGVTSHICEKHGYDSALLDLTEDVHFATQGPAVPDMIPDVWDEDLLSVLNVITAAVIAMVIGGGGIAIFNIPLIGQIVAFFISIFVFWIGSEATKKWAGDVIKEWDMPAAGRFCFTEDAIRNKIANASPKLVEMLKKNLQTTRKNSDGTTLEGIEIIVAKQLEAGLKQRADDAILSF